MSTTKATMGKSVKTTNLCISVIQTSDDIIKSHGGELKVESEVDEGTKFIVQLNLKSTT